MSTPKPPDGVERPTFFIDRDLGRIAFPDGLRAAGLSIVTIAEHYGVQAGEQIEDETWMFEAAEHDWPVCCDSKHRKRRRPAERAALLSSGLREFVLNGNVTAQENVVRVRANLGPIATACTRPGPFVYTSVRGHARGRTGGSPPWSTERHSQMSSESPSSLTL